jgi:hypothetical protein
MKAKIFVLFVLTSVIVTFTALTKQQVFHHPEFGEISSRPSFGISSAYAYPPAVGILSNSKNCMSCHTSNGPWKEEDKLVIDILDMETKKSLKQSDGSFLIEVKRPLLNPIEMPGYILIRQLSVHIPFQNLLPTGM